VSDTPPQDPETPETSEMRDSAVALAHDPDSATAPKIIAKGKGELAKQILDTAFANGIKVREDKDLVQLLEQFEVETNIPPEAFATVAEILNYLYKLNGTYSEETAVAADFSLKEAEDDNRN